MIKSLTIFCLLLIFNMTEAQIQYPVTKKVDSFTTYFNTKVAEPYRWLENDRSKETEDWVKEQNKLTFDYLSKIPYRETIKKEMTDIWNYEKIGIPTKYGDYIYFSKNSGLQKHSVTYRKSKNNQQEEVFLDPNKWSSDGRISLAGMSFSKDGSLCSYMTSDGGLDWNNAYIIRTNEKERIIDSVLDIKFSGIDWYKNEGFYYSTYDKNVESKKSSLTNDHKVYYHKLGTPQSQDVLIFQGKEKPIRYSRAEVSEDTRFLIIEAAQNTKTNELYIKDLNNPTSDFVRITENDKYTVSYFDNKGDDLYIVTNENAPKNALLKINFNQIALKKWDTIIPNGDYTLNLRKAGGSIFNVYSIHVNNSVAQYDYTGKKIKDITLPGEGNVNGFSADADDKDLYYSFTNSITPTTLYKMNIASGVSELYFKPNVKFNSENFKTKQVFYKSNDGTIIPMTLTYRKDLVLNGKNPTILYGYGGFKITVNSTFSPSVAVWIQNGGIYAIANIRGGGEYGDNWHKSGTKLNKKNVFNDFIAAAEFLKSEGYTSTEYLAIKGGSNGGLLVGATITTQPNVCQVALPAVGVMDMLKYHKFTSGAGWAYDYGTSDDNAEMFNYLYSYSPVHNVKSGICYPATMVTTGDHDDRVVPSHSFKFAAELQAKNKCTKPSLIRINTNAGHGSGKSTDVLINEITDEFSFSLWNMGIKSLKTSTKK